MIFFLEAHICKWDKEHEMNLKNIQTILFHEMMFVLL